MVKIDACMPSKISLKHSIQKIVILGTGNLSNHLVKILSKHYTIIQIYGRNLDKTTYLANKVGAVSISDLNLISSSADLYILAVSDDAVPSLAKRIKLVGEKILVHTSGSLPKDILLGSANHIGVFYPLQSFKKNQTINWSTLSILCTASSTWSKQQLVQLALKYTKKVHCISDQQRQSIHLAAVFAHNFSNILYSISADILRQIDLPFSVLQPLIKTQIEKLNDLDPLSIQTGPAIRGDIQILEKHIKYLNTHHPDYKPIYEMLSRLIRDIHHKENQDA